MKKYLGLLILSIIAINLSACTTMANAERPKVDSDTTVVYLTRHAKKAKSPKKDPELTAEGQKQASSLAKYLTDIKLDAIYSTPFKRTMNTAGPTAASQDINITSEYVPAKAFATKIKNLHQGQTILVVGHSNTVPALIAELGVAQAVSIGHHQYGDLYKVTIHEEEISLTQTAY